MRYPILALTLAAACSPVTEADTGLIRWGEPADGRPQPGAGLFGSINTPASHLRHPAWTPGAERGDALGVAQEEAPQAAEESPYPFPHLPQAEREALLASQQGPQRLHGYLLVNTDSEAALLEHYQDMPLATLHRMHLDLERLLSRRDLHSLPHTVNGWPLDADALPALKREQAWLYQRLHSQLERDADSLLARYAQTGWEPGYAQLDAQGIRYELWLTQRLLSREKGATGRFPVLR